MSRRLRQNIVRRFGEYHFTKKLSAGAGWRTIAFSSSIRQPPQVMMVGAQVNAQFHLLSPLVMSGALTIDQFRGALAEIAAETAASRQQTLFEYLTGQRAPPADAVGEDMEAKLLEADVKAGKVLELVAKHGRAMCDANFFIEMLDASGFTDDEIRALLCEFYPRVEALLEPIETAEAPRPIAERLQQSGVSPDCARLPYVRRTILSTVGKTLVKTAAAAARQDICNVDAIAVEAVANAYSRPAPAAPAPLAVETPRLVPAMPASPPAPRAPSVDQHPFVLGAAAFLKKAEKYGGRRETSDVEAVSRLFAEFLIEKGVHDLRGLRQRHFADFRDVFDVLPTHWGTLYLYIMLIGSHSCGAHYPNFGSCSVCEGLHGSAPT